MKRAAKVRKAEKMRHMVKQMNTNLFAWVKAVNTATTITTSPEVGLKASKVVMASPNKPANITKAFYFFILLGKRVGIHTKRTPIGLFKID